jgi:EAL domain-containing protein (putative c-di-GMP-specific phosphodiesterase class I)/GGDEF domain-containing protein
MTAHASVAAGKDDPQGSLVAVLVARRQQIAVRLGLCYVIAVIFQALSGVGPALVWVAIYTVFQIAERFLFRGVTEATGLSAGGRLAFVAAMVVSNILFAAFGIAEAAGGGVWGLLCAGLLWSGAILNGAMVSGDSKVALAASILPPILFFLAVPVFVVDNGGSLEIGLAIVAGGGLNGVGAIAIWSATRRLLVGAARERETARRALLDPATGLPNRYALQLRVAALRATGQGGIVVAAIGIDRFDHLSGALGPGLTVDLLREVAARLATVTATGDIASLSASMLGTAWVVGDAAEARLAALHMRQAMETPVMLGENPVDVSLTVGLSGYFNTSGAISEMAMVERAIVAIGQGRRTHQPVAEFDPALYAHAAGNLSLMSEMLEAIASDRMNVHYQPKRDFKSGGIVGLEALVRWTHPERGALRPDEFVPLAEETGRIAALTEWVLRRAVVDQRRLGELGYPLTVSINLSGRLIGNPDFTRTILAIAGSASGELVLEVTETAIIHDLAAAQQTLAAIRAAGIGVSIDDYGSGLSSLGYLKHIPCDELKIDKTFVLNLGEDRTDAILVASVISLAHSLGLKVVAEGVETEGALMRLSAMGCDLAQGYFIARPMPLGDLQSFLERSTILPDQRKRRAIA